MTQQNCPALFKLNRRSGNEQWVLTCTLEKGHGGWHKSPAFLFKGDDR